LIASGDTLFAGTDSGRVFISNTNGSLWTKIDSGLPNNSIQFLAMNGNTLFAGTKDSGVFRCTQNETKWIAVNSGLTHKYILSLAISGDYLFAGVSDSNKSGGVWQRPLSEMPEETRSRQTMSASKQSEVTIHVSNNAGSQIQVTFFLLILIVSLQKYLMCQEMRLKRLWIRGANRARMESIGILETRRPDAI
jgi:hypothetical protein